MSSEDDFGIPEEKLGQGLAVAAEALFLLNLLAFPGLAFAILAGLWFKFRASAPPLARQHLKQATWVSFWGGLLIVVLSAAFLLLGVLMVLGGLTEPLGRAVEATGSLGLFLGPAVGAFGGFLTGSGAGANAMFAAAQGAVA